ncbi:MAG: transglutaminase family protein [Hyphomicrobiales bacterium]
MRISVLHQTRYGYEAPVAYSAQRLRLTPAAHDGQKVLAWNIEAPGIDEQAACADCFGNLTHLLTVVGEHQDLTITVRGEVETVDTHGVVSGLACAVPDYVFLRETELTRPSSAIRELAQDARTGADVDLLHGLMTAIHERVNYQVGVTHTATSAADAFEAGEGVCQDHAHIFISAARVLGFPARYVTGYLIVDEDDSAAAHHAWAEVRVGDLGWVGFDVANRICPTESYVRLACGLDYQYASPIRGMRRGGGDEDMSVHVVVQQAAQQQ